MLTDFWHGAWTNAWSHFFILESTGGKGDSFRALQVLKFVLCLPCLKVTVYECIYMEFRKMVNDNPVCETAKETQIYRTVFWTLWERARVG